MTTKENTTMQISFKASASTAWQPLAVNDETDEQGSEEARKSKDELKNILLSSLQMQHVVVLAGSGCSISAGGPSMQGLWEASIGASPSDEANAAAAKINYDLTTDQNIEAFLSKAEAYLQIKDDEDVNNFVNSCKRVIMEECTTFLNLDKLATHKSFLHRLSRRRVRDQRLKLFTTNYDLCFERAASELGGVAIDGFSFTAPRTYDPRYFGYDIIRRPRSGDDLGNYLEGVFLLYKLHGSVNWARSDDGAIRENTNPKPEQACLIYPASGKYQQSFLQPHLESMAQYLAAVREPNTCLLTVGFGFNDDHLAEPLLAAVQSNPHLRLIIADPMARDKDSATNNNRYWQKFFEFGERGEDIWFVNAPFPQFAQMVPDLKSLTPADTLKKAIQGVARER